jgi:hypothetical protein
MSSTWRVGINEAITWQAYFLLQEGGTLDPARPSQQTQQHTQQQQQQQQQLTSAATAGAKPSTGTISGMLADFSKALGLYSACVVGQVPLISHASSLQLISVDCIENTVYGYMVPFTQYSHCFLQQNITTTERIITHHRHSMRCNKWGFPKMSVFCLRVYFRELLEFL